MPTAADFRAAVRREGGLSRRLFLASGATLSALVSHAQHGSATAPKVAFPADPFTLGVASGDPLPEGFVIWTRLAPKPLQPDGGMPPEAVEVRWELADDEQFKTRIASGAAVATPQLGHSVHVEVDGLKPDRWYFYRFLAGDATSAVGRARTAPAPAAAPEKLRFAFASCQHYEYGLFTAYEQMAKDDLDLVFFLGDYIYEREGKDKFFRKHPTGKLFTLADYRCRHALYRSDPLLQRAHARCPWVVTWDDHEVENNYASAASERAGADPAEVLEMRAAAYQAYYEMMPLRKRSVPRGPDMKLYRTQGFGRLASFQVLDTRQYRTRQPNGTKPGDINDDALSPKNTMLGAHQAGWLKGALLKSTATWNVLAQQVMMGMVDRSAGDDKRYSMDQWPGYASERMALVRFLAERRVPNPVVLTGDIHSNWVSDLRVDDRKPETPVVATEFVGTSVTSGGNGLDKPKDLDALAAKNPCVRFHNRQRGYVRCTVTPKEWRSDFMVVADVTRPGVPAALRAAFAVEAGTAGARPVVG
ncbi:alkaline phosphatase D family protein [Gemmata sp.]|uniref:alkaline phosphatase D family protein n=1 Tax=Gemmata sp. TaxID=1914242 RepID=UPI003F71BCAF